MQTVRIFIASSYEMSDWREAIGDAIRQWSDRLESDGYRIRMECWEDYHPEYTGIRKQDEYNEELVRRSDLFFALFRTRCGDFTTEEIRVALDERIDVSIVKDVAGVASPELESYLSTLDKVHNVANCSEAIEFIQGKLMEYISNLPRFRPDGYRLESKQVYATIPQDRAQNRNAIGNMIRSLDVLSEEVLGVRCRYKTDSIEDLKECDYYMAILKDRLEDDDIGEISHAVVNTFAGSHLSYSIFYYNHGDKALETCAHLKKLVSEKGIFECPFDSVYRIKFNLLVWLLSQRLLVIDKSSRMKVRDGMIYYCTYPIVSAAVLGYKDLSDPEILDKLLADIRGRLLGLLQHDSQAADKPVDLKALDKDIQKAKAVNDLAEGLYKAARETQRTLMAEIGVRISYIEQNIRGEDVAELLGLYGRRIDLEEYSVSRNWLDPESLLRTELARINHVEAFPEIAYRQNLDVDELYGRVAALADRYGVIDPEIEMKRMNYANYLARYNRHQEALEVYAQTLTNMHKLDDGSVLMVNYLPPLYLNYIHDLTNLGLEDRAVTIVSEFEQNIEKWNDRGLLDFDVRAYRILCISARLVFRNSKNFIRYIRQGLEYWGLLKDNVDLRVPVWHKLWDDVYCYFPVALSSAIIDSGQNGNRVIDFIKSLVERACLYLGHGVNIDELRRTVMKANLYHNLAKAYSDSGYTVDARAVMTKVLRLRRLIYSMAPTPASEAFIAEALLMLGATYINGNYNILPQARFEAALGYAEECLAIYKNLNQGFLEQETRVYEALLLKGTILYYNADQHLLGVRLIKDCYAWSKNHPENSYREVIESEYKRLIR